MNNILTDWRWSSALCHTSSMSASACLLICPSELQIAFCLIGDQHVLRSDGQQVLLIVYQCRYQWYWSHVILNAHQRTGFGTGMTLAFFHKLGKWPSLNDALKIAQTGPASNSAMARNTQFGSWSGPGAFHMLMLDSLRSTSLTLMTNSFGRFGYSAGIRSSGSGSKSLDTLLKNLLICCTNSGRLPLDVWFAEPIMSACVDFFCPVSWRVALQSLHHVRESLLL